MYALDINDFICANCGYIHAALMQKAKQKPVQCYRCHAKPFKSANDETKPFKSNDKTAWSSEQFL